MHYVGRDMKQSYRGMKISEQYWEIFSNHLKATLSNFNRPDQEYEETVAFIESAKKDIVEWPDGLTGRRDQEPVCVYRGGMHEIDETAQLCDAATPVLR